MSAQQDEAPPPYPGLSNNYSSAADYGFNANNYPAPSPNVPPKGAPPAPANYAPHPYGAPQHNHATVIVTQPTVTLVQTFREAPVRTRCNHCSAEIVTGIHYETGTFTWVICFVLWLVGCGLGCCLIPFCVDGCKDVVHTCPNCMQSIARFSRM